MKTFDVIIVGAGASGLMAAKQLSYAGKSVCIIEAKNHIGGRINTLTDERFSYPVETGAEFIHGKLPCTFKLIKEAGLDYYTIKGNAYEAKKGIWNKENDFIERADELEKALKKIHRDTPLKNFLTKYFPGAQNKSFRDSVTRYAEGYDAADTSKFSTLAFKNELENEDEENYRLTNGYRQLIQYLWNQCEARGVNLRLNTAVKEIHWLGKTVRIISKDENMFTAKQVVVTIPVGVWQSRKGSKGAIHFIPELKEKKAAAKQLGFGGVIKVIIQFDEVFWKDKAKKIGFILSNQTIPTWWTQQPDKYPMLSGWVAGPAAEKMKKLNNEAILKKAIASLALIFQMPVKEILKKIIASYVFNWLADPFIRGAYCYQVIGANENRKLLSQPVANRLFFAGEAMYHGSEMGTVEAALASGEQVAQQVLSREKII